MDTAASGKGYLGGRSYRGLVQCIASSSAQQFPSNYRCSIAKLLNAIRTTKDRNYSSIDGLLAMNSNRYYRSFPSSTNPGVEKVLRGATTMACWRYKRLPMGFRNTPALMTFMTTKVDMVVNE
eukprot:284814892_2